MKPFLTRSAFVVGPCRVVDHLVDLEAPLVVAAQLGPVLVGLLGAGATTLPTRSPKRATCSSASFRSSASGRCRSSRSLRLGSIWYQSRPAA